MARHSALTTNQIDVSFLDWWDNTSGGAGGAHEENATVGMAFVDLENLTVSWWLLSLFPGHFWCEATVTWRDHVSLCVSHVGFNCKSTTYKTSFCSLSSTTPVQWVCPFTDISLSPIKAHMQYLHKPHSLDLRALMGITINYIRTTNAQSMSSYYSSNIIVKQLATSCWRNTPLPVGKVFLTTKAWPFPQVNTHSFSLSPRNRIRGSGIISWNLPLSLTSWWSQQGQHGVLLHNKSPT